MNKSINPPWLPDIEKSNFDPEYTSLPLDFSPEDIANNPIPTNNNRR